MKEYAAIGTRDLYSEQSMLCYRVGKLMAQHGWILHTGAAQGADQTYALGALRAGGRVMLHLPWDTYERHWVAEVRAHYPGKVRSQSVEESPQYTKAEGSVLTFHPAADRLKRGALLLHARNYNIISPYLDNPVRFVVALPSSRGGGTMQGIRVAKALHVPVIRADKLPPPEIKKRLDQILTQPKEGPL